MMFYNIDVINREKVATEMKKIRIAPEFLKIPRRVIKLKRLNKIKIVKLANNILVYSTILYNFALGNIPKQY